MKHQNNTKADSTVIIERLAKTEQQVDHLGARMLGVEVKSDKHTKVLSQQAAELQLHKADLDNKFEKSIMHFESLEKSIISLKEVVDSVVPVLNNMVAKKTGSDQAKAKIAKIVLGTLTAIGTIVGITVAIVKLNVLS